MSVLLERVGMVPMAILGRGLLRRGTVPLANGQAGLGSSSATNENDGYEPLSTFGKNDF
jgi:hypothetical protein